MASSLPKFSYKGVEYTFVETQVQLLEELKCPICLDLVNQPVSTSCQHLFCENCIKDQHTCPTCRKRISGTIPDVGSTRLLKAFKVKCPNEEQGCEWEGHFGDSEEHLEKNCQQQMVKCPNRCGKKNERRLIRSHTELNCPNRRYTCPHCDHVGVYKDVTTVHFTNCRDFPLLCPAGCRKKVTRKNMESHLSAECPEEYVSCKYTIFGCDTAVRRREKESHFSDDTLHLKNLMELQIPLLLSLSKCFLTKSLDSADVTSLPLFFRPWLQNTSTCYPRPPWVVKLEGFEEKKRNNKGWYSNPVYSHFGGYKMCLSVYPNGDGIRKGIHVSVFVYLMKGDNDENLKFPFERHVVISLLNQLDNQNHRTRELWSPEKNIPEASSARVTTGEMSSTGWGHAQFIPQKDLNYNSDKNCQYLKNDCLFFRVDKFECVF